MTSQKEEQIIHAALAHMFANLDGPNYLPDILTKVGYDDNRHISPILIRLQTEGLTTETSSPYWLLLTSKGTDIARTLGGYMKFKDEQRRQESSQQQKQNAKEELDRKAAEATIEGPKVNKKAIKISIVSIIVSTAFSIYSMVESNELANAKNQIRALQGQVNALVKQSAPAPRAKSDPLGFGVDARQKTTGVDWGRKTNQHADRQGGVYAPKRTPKPGTAGLY